MIDVLVEKVNECFIKIKADYSIQQEIKNYFSFKVDGYQFSPKYKAKLWDGTISLYQSQRSLLPIGLYPRLVDFCNDSKLNIEFQSNDRFDSIDELPDVELEDIKSFVDSLNLWSKKGPIAIRDYQLDAILHAIKNKKVTLKSPTSSGKSMIVYAIIRWILSEYPDARILLLVPSVSLVNQMLGDFREYALQDDKFDVDKNCQKLYSGQTKELSKRVLITTWQSFTKIANDKVNGPKILSLYKCVINDECHTAKGKEIQSILEKCIYSDYKIGTTGTIDEKSKVNQLVIEGFLGPIYKVTTTKELMDAKQVSGLKIKALVLKYPEAVCKENKDLTYPDEVKWLVQNADRNNIIKKITLSLDGTTLVLVRNRDTHAKVLYEMVKAVSKKPVYYIAGDVDAEDREEIRQIINNGEEDCIIFATFQTMSTGSNIPTIKNVLFGSPSKSSITVLQSIGRGLRLHENKTHMNLIDLIDDLRYKKRENYAYQHALERLTIYRKENFEISIKEIAAK